MLSTHNYMFEMVKVMAGVKCVAAITSANVQFKFRCLLTCLLKLALPENLACQSINVLVNFPVCMKLKMEVVTFC